jgi:hypothetical protein
VTSLRLIALLDNGFLELGPDTSMSPRISYMAARPLLLPLLTRVDPVPSQEACEVRFDVLTLTPSVSQQLKGIV